MKPQADCVFSVDVEDWFHILELESGPSVEEWEALPSRVERNFRRLLDVFSETDTRVTCFFLGWVAQRYPHLLREAAQRGHEIASHGHHHLLIHHVSRAEFLEDAAAAKKVLEDICGRPVVGYRASGFSVTDQTPWFFSALVEAGYQYDSSVFPAARAHGGGFKQGKLSPYLVKTENGEITEFPMSVASIAGKRLCFFGGGYLRLFPLPLIRHMTRRVLREGRPAIFYLHPREIDPDHPRLPMSAVRRFKCYVNLRGTERKVRCLLSEFSMGSFAQWISNHAERPMASSEATLGVFHAAEGTWE